MTKRRKPSPKQARKPKRLPRKKKPPPPREGVSLQATVCDLCAGYDGPNCVYACPHDAAIRVAPGAFLSP